MQSLPLGNFETVVVDFNSLTFFSHEDYFEMALFELDTLHRILGLDLNVAYDLLVLGYHCLNCFCVVQSEPLCSVVVPRQHILDADFARPHTEILS